MDRFELWEMLIYEPLNTSTTSTLPTTLTLQTLEYSNTLNQVEHFESVRLSVELEGVVGLKIEFNALECPGGNMSWVIQITNTPELLVTLNCSGGNMNELINVSVGWRC